MLWIVQQDIEENRTVNGGHHLGLTAGIHQRSRRRAIDRALATSQKHLAPFSFGRSAHRLLLKIHNGAGIEAECIAENFRNRDFAVVLNCGVHVVKVGNSTELVNAGPIQPA